MTAVSRTGSPGAGGYTPPEGASTASVTEAGASDSSGRSAGGASAADVLPGGPPLGHGDHLLARSCHGFPQHRGSLRDGPARTAGDAPAASG